MDPTKFGDTARHVYVVPPAGSTRMKRIGPHSPESARKEPSAPANSAAPPGAPAMLVMILAPNRPLREELSDWSRTRAKADARGPFLRLPKKSHRSLARGLRWLPPVVGGRHVRASSPNSSCTPLRPAGAKVGCGSTLVLTCRSESIHAHHTLRASSHKFSLYQSSAAHKPVRTV